MPRICLVCLSCFFVSSCIPFVSGEYSEVVVMPDYKKRRLEGQRLAIRISPHDFTIHNKSDVTRYFGVGLPEERYWDFFKQHFPEYIKAHSTFTDVYVPASVPETAFKERLLALDSDALVLMDLPEDGNLLTIDGRKADYVLFMKEFSIFHRDGDPGRPVLRPEVPDEPNDIPGVWRPRNPNREPQEERDPEYDLWHTGVRYSKILHQVVYTLWDNTNGRVVSYGDLSVNEGGGKKNTWEENLEALAKEIVRKSPFRR